MGKEATGSYGAEAIRTYCFDKALIIAGMRKPETTADLDAVIKDAKKIEQYVLHGKLDNK